MGPIGNWIGQEGTWLMAYKFPSGSTSKMPPNEIFKLCHAIASLQRETISCATKKYWEDRWASANEVYTRTASVKL